MLIEKTVKLGDIVSIKLVSSEELVAKLVEQDTSTVTISKPLVLSISVDERTGKPGLQMYPFFMLGADTDDKITLQRSHIIALVISREDVKSGYVQNTTGITIPSPRDKGLIA